MNHSFCDKMRIPTEQQGRISYDQGYRSQYKSIKKRTFLRFSSWHALLHACRNDILHVWVYPEPWCFEQTSDDVKTLKDFPFTGEGLDESLEWISQEFEERKDYWMQMEKDKMKMIL